MSLGAPRRRDLEIQGPFDLVGSLRIQQLGSFDPTMRVGPSELWRASRLPSGPATLHVVQQGPARATATAWGPGAQELLEVADQILGLHDEPGAFAPDSEILRPILLRHRGLRLPKVPDLLRVLVQSILQQRVRWQDATNAFRQLVLRYGEPAPGPNPDLFVLPQARVMARLPGHVYSAIGVEHARARVVVRVCQSYRRVEELATMSPDDAIRRLRAFPGVGPWTTAMTLGHGLGYADVVPTGDVGLPRLVSWTLAEERWGDDDRMVELLEPYRPHRFRVVRLLQQGGRHPPKRSPGRRLGPLPGDGRR